MSDQPAPVTAPAPDPPGEESELERYFRANRAMVTEAALRRAALEAGHSPAAVDAALVATRDRSEGAAGTATRRIFIAYLAVWLILDALMLINPANSGGSGFLGDTRGIGIMILSISLGVGFLASLVWIASRRGFFALAGILLVLFGVSNMNAIVPAALAIGGGAVLALLALRGRPTTPSTPTSAATVELLMSMPLLILIVVGGICLASGLPIPRAV